MVPGMNDRPEKKRDDWITRAQARDKWFPLAMLGAAIGAYIAREGSLFANSGGIVDSALGIFTLAFIAWCLWPSSKSDDKG